jgi:hypothetical protein
MNQSGIPNPFGLPAPLSTVMHQSSEEAMTMRRAFTLIGLIRSVDFGRVSAYAANAMGALGAVPSAQVASAP